MADIKISALPVANEIWNLNEIIPVVNSGSTTTSKRTYGSLFSNHSGGTYTITSTDQTYAIIACGSSSPNTHIRIGGINNAAVISSRGANITSGQMNTIIGSEQDNDSSQPTINGGQYNTIIGSKGGVSTSGNHQFIANSVNGQIYGGEYNTLIGTQGFYTGPNCNKAAGISVESGGWDGPRYAIAAGGYQLTCTNDGGNDHAALAFNGLTFDGTSKGGFLYKVLGAAVQSGTIQNDIAALIASSGQTTEYDQTLHTDHIFSFLGEGTKWRDGGNVSGSINVDLSQGSLYSFTITGNLTTISLDNTRIGGMYEFWVYNSGSFTISTIVLDGGTSNCFAKSGSVNPTNSGYTFYRLRVVDDGSGNKRGILNEHLNFQAL